MKLKVTTVSCWEKKSEHLFDYEKQRTKTHIFFLPLKDHSYELYQVVQKNYRDQTAFRTMIFDTSKLRSLDQEKLVFLSKLKVQVSEKGSTTINLINKSNRKQDLSLPCQREHEEKQDYSWLSQEGPYLVVRKQNEESGYFSGCKIEPGQIIKLGKAELFVSQMRIDNQITQEKYSEHRQFSKLCLKYKEKAQNFTCKICLCEEETADNFIINPCDCSGSIGNVHVECFTRWVQSKVTIQDSEGNIHCNFQNFVCEVCKAELPLKIQKENGDVLEVIALNRPLGNYLVLQSCSRLKEIFIIKCDKESTFFGRSKQSQIVLKDISVSRAHAFIKFLRGSFYIFDNKSKFGTLLKKKNLELELNDRGQQGVQIGRTMITFEVVGNYQDRMKKFGEPWGQEIDNLDFQYKKQKGNNYE